MPLKYRLTLGLLVVLLSGILLISVVVDTGARPEFAARENKECAFCHLDPAGGGPRNPIGQIFEDNYFEFPEDFDPEAVMQQVEEVEKRLTTAVNMQVAYIKTTEVDLEERAVANCDSCHSSVDSFFMMRGELTVNAHVSNKLQLTASNNMGAILDMFATVNAVPGRLYVKVGQFQIPFTIKQKDHNMLVRQGYNLGSNKRDVGVEIGGSFSKLFYSAAVFNGGNPTIFNGGSGPGADTNQHKGWTATVGGAVGPLRGGVSYLWDKPAERREMVVGAFLTAAYKGLSLEGEFDFGGSFADDESIGFSDEDITSKGYYFGAKYRIIPEFTVSGRYELFDPSRTILGDASQRVTLSARYIFIENGSLELFYWLNVENEDRDKTAANRQLEGVDQFILMSHFWF
jgi:hypothetical protein